MTAVENFFIYKPGRHNLRPGRHFQQNYRDRGNQWGTSHRGIWIGCKSVINAAFVKKVVWIVRQHAKHGTAWFVTIKKWSMNVTITNGIMKKLLIVFTCPKGSLNLKTCFSTKFLVKKLLNPVKVINPWNYCLRSN